MMTELINRTDFEKRAAELLGVSSPDVLETLYPMVSDLQGLIATVHRFDLTLVEDFDESRLSETATGEA